MKKKLSKMILGVLSVLAVSCSSEQTTSPDISGVPLQLQCSGSDMTVTRGIATRSEVSLPASTQMGVYALEQTTPVASAGENVLYTTTDGLSFSSSSPVLINLRKSYSVLAYAPQATGLADASAVKFNHGTDLLYAPSVAVTIDQAQAKSTAVLLFTHKMSQIRFKLVSGMGTPDLSGASLSVTGFYEYGTLNLTDGVFTPVAGLGASVTQIDTPVCFVPTTAALTLVVKVVTADGTNYTATISRTFAVSESYSYTLTVNKVQAELGISASLVDWTPVDGGNVSVEG